MRLLSGVLILLVLLTTGCRVGPRYTPPCVEVPEEWKTVEQEPVAQAPVDYWWEVFGDETLNHLEVKAIENNPSLYSALERVVEARAMATVAGAGLYPQLLLQPSYSNSGQLFKLYLPNQAFPAANPNLSVFRIHMLQYVLPLTMNYELDLWGRIRSEYESEVYNAESQAEAYHASMLTLTTDLANAYFQLKVLDSQVQLIEETLKVRLELLEQTKVRFARGLANDLDVSSSALDAANTESLFVDAKRQRGLIENMIAALIGEPAAEFSIAPTVLVGEPPSIPAGLPAEVLMQRPDIAQSERTRAAQHMQIGVAYASFLPSITLTGILGYSSPDLREFFSWISRWWSFGVSSSETVFDGYRDCGYLQAAWARFRQADAGYRQQVITAFKEVEDALNNIEYQAKQYESLDLAFQEAEKRRNLSATRFEKGLVNILEVLNNQEVEISTQINLSNALGQRYLSTIQLIKALGGGWNTRECVDERTILTPIE